MTAQLGKQANFVPSGFLPHFKVNGYDLEKNSVIFMLASLVNGSSLGANSFLKEKIYFRKALSSMETNRKSWKFFPFVNTVKKHTLSTLTKSVLVLYICR